MSSDYHDAVLVLLMSCAVDASRLDQTRLQPELEGPQIVAPGPPTAAGAPLYQQLNVDEVGEEAHALGQRARMLAWLRGLDFSDAQLEGLLAASARIYELAEEEQRADEALGAKELEELGPVYEELILALVSPEDPDWEAHGARLEEARGRLEDPHARQLQGVKDQLQAAETWIASLTPTQQQALATSRFFLRKQLGAMVNPGDHEALIGTRWDAGDFDSKRLTEGDGEGMDLGGLWSSEPFRAHPDNYLSPLQVQAITLLALTEPGLVEAAEVLLGRRDPLDLRVGEPANPLE